jgi:hypothetical protein
MRHKRIQSEIPCVAFLFFSTAALLVFSGITLSPGHVFCASPDAQVLVHPREIQRADHQSIKPFVPATIRELEPPFRKPDMGLYMEPENGLAFFTDGREIPCIPELSAPEGRADTPEPDTAEIPPISRQPDNRISLKEEMVNLEDLDIGKTGGMIQWKVREKKKMEGFLFIPIVWGEDYSPPLNGINRDDRSYFYFGPTTVGESAIRLAEAVNRYAGVPVHAGRNIFLSSRQILKMPFLFMFADRSFELTKTERRNLGDYLSHGGFLFMDNAAPVTEWGPAEASLKKMIRDVLGAKALFQPIPLSHPVYHSFFDFEDGPPQGSENGGFNPSTDTHTSAGYPSGPYMKMSKPVFFLEGVYIGDELVAVYSNKGYALRWNRRTDNTPQLKFGVNLVVYALTREGGMNARAMERYGAEETARQGKSAP